MTVKKLALLGVASLVSFGAIAGGPAACAPAAQVSGIYVGVDAGASHNPTLDVNENNASNGLPFTTLTAVSHKHTPWAWTVSGLVGYQYDNNWSLEFGYIWNQKQSLSFTGTIVPVTDTSLDDGTLKLKSYNLYLAAKGTLPLTDQFSAYMLVGPAYTHLNWKVTNATTTSYSKTDSFFSPMAALGVSYAMDECLSFNMQYMFIADDSSNNSDSIGSTYSTTQRISVGANYMFAL